MRKTFFISILIFLLCSCVQPAEEPKGLNLPSWLIGEWITDRDAYMTVKDGNIIAYLDEAYYNMLELRDKQGYIEYSDMRTYSLSKGDQAFTFEKVRGGVTLYRKWDSDFTIRFDFY